MSDELKSNAPGATPPESTTPPPAAELTLFTPPAKGASYDEIAQQHQRLVSEGKLEAAAAFHAKHVATFKAGK